MIEAIDSYYNFIVQQVGIVNPSQAFGGIVEARDWPQTPPNIGSLYLLVLAAQPSGGTQSQVLFTYHMQWVWLLMGTDIQSTQQSANRGDVYRANFLLMKNLRDAHAFGFCPKQVYSASSTGVVTATPINSPAVGGAESVWWNQPRQMPKRDQKSGIYYGGAMIDVFAFDDVSAAIVAA